MVNYIPGMTSKPVTERLCEPYKKDNKQIKARPLCNECHTLLCEPCSDYHKRLRATKVHNLMEFAQFMQKKSSQNDPSLSKQISTSVNDDELTSDLLETLTLTDDTVLYRGAQVAVESTSVTTEPEKRRTSKQADPTRLKCKRCLEFSVKRPEDKEKVWVKNVLCVSDNVVVVDYFNKVLKLFNQSGAYQSCTELKNSTWGITCVSDSTFATCGYCYTVYLWTVRGQTIVRDDISYHIDHIAHGIHYNGTYYCVLHRKEKAITILDRQGRQVRKIIMKEACGKMFWFGCDIHMDSDANNIYVPCMHEYGVLCMTKEGKALWFTPLSGILYGITEIQGTLCVADFGGSCLHLITKRGKYVKKLLDKEDLGGRPSYTCYGQNGKLFVSYFWNDDKYHIICYYSV